MKKSDSLIVFLFSGTKLKIVDSAGFQFSGKWGSSFLNEIFGFTWKGSRMTIGFLAHLRL